MPKLMPCMHRVHLVSTIISDNIMVFGFYFFSQEVIDILKQPRLLPEWDPQIKSLKNLSAASNHDVISLSFNCSNIFVKTVQYIRDFFGEEVNTVFSR